MSAVADHMAGLSTMLLRYRDEEFLCDTLILTDSQSIKAHSVLLAACSPVFHDAFASAETNGGMYQIDLQNVETHIMQTALDFIYTGNLVVQSPEFASHDRLADLFSTFRDLGLDIDKLNGVKVKYRSDLKNELLGKPTGSARKVDGMKTEDVRDSFTIELDSSMLESVTSKQLTEESGWKCTVDEDGNKIRRSVKLPSVHGSEEDDEETASMEDNEVKDGIDDEDALMDASQDERYIMIESKDGDQSQFIFMLISNYMATDAETERTGIVLHKPPPTGQKTFNCHMCNRRFSNKQNLLSHVKILHDLEPDEFEHSVLEKPDVISEEGQDLDDAMTFNCAACGELLSGVDKIREHLENSSTCLDSEQTTNALAGITLDFGQRPFLCDTCGKNFSSALSLRLHTKLHTGERPYTCSTCNKSFVQKIQLTNHERGHLGIRPFVCDRCDRSFLQKGQLSLHMRMHTGERPYICEFCDAAFVSKAMLTAHRRLHTGERPHVCATCSKSFTHKESLIVHIRTHTGEKPFECTICGNRYTQSHHLKGHMRTHTGEKPFACHMCEKSYKNRVDLRFHCSRVHNVNITKRKPYKYSDAELIMENKNDEVASV